VVLVVLAGHHFRGSLVDLRGNQVVDPLGTMVVPQVVLVVVSRVVRGADQEAEDPREADNVARVDTEFVERQVARVEELVLAEWRVELVVLEDQTDVDPRNQPCDQAVQDQIAEKLAEEDGCTRPNKKDFEGRNASTGCNYATQGRILLGNAEADRVHDPSLCPSEDGDPRKEG
jgi:hypothetical protein